MIGKFLIALFWAGLATMLFLPFIVNAQWKVILNYGF